MSNIEILILIITIGFIVLVIFISKLCYDLFFTLNKVNQTLEVVTIQVQNLDNEPKELIHNINKISSNISHKVESLDSLFNSIQDVGDSLENQAIEVKKKSTCHCNNNQINYKKNILENVLDLGVILMSIIKNNNRR